MLGGRVWVPPVPEPTVEPSGLTYCGEIESKEKRRIELAANEMRRTTEAANLLTALVRNEICIGVEDLSFNSGYTFASTRFGRPIVERIIIDTDTLEFLTANEAAAVLVHEATHAARWLARTDCRFADDCQMLANGVVVE